MAELTDSPSIGPIVAPVEQPPARVRADPECPRCSGRGYVVDTSRGGLSLALCVCVVRVTEVAGDE